MRLEIRDYYMRHGGHEVLGWLAETPEGVALEAATPSLDDDYYWPAARARGEEWQREIAEGNLSRLRRLLGRDGSLPKPGHLPGILEAVEVPDEGDYPALAREVVPRGERRG
jgi:hypothetical protein